MGRDVKNNPSEYQKVVNDLKARSAKQQQNTISFRAKRSTAKPKETCSSTSVKETEVTQEQEHN